LKRSFSRGRSVLRRIADLMVLVALLAMVTVALQKAGWLMPESGRFTAIDGDSLRKGESEYRLHAIDAPEFRQSCKTAEGKDYACGRESHEALKKLISGRTLDCAVTETDRYRRLVAECRSGELNVNDEMVRQGWAIAYIAHGLDHAAAEAEARAARRGIWQGQFDPPEKWRASHRHVQSGLGEEEAQPD
jgi:endonuclease YncB( thermonuclease family)